jgi:hypothetical protein
MILNKAEVELFDELKRVARAIASKPAPCDVQSCLECSDDDDDDDVKIVEGDCYYCGANTALRPESAHFDDCPIRRAVELKSKGRI